MLLIGKIKRFLRKVVLMIFETTLFTEFLSERLNTFLYYPIFNDPEELTHHYFSALYYIPMRENARTLFLVSDKIEGLLNNIKTEPPPEYIGSCHWDQNGGIEFKTVKSHPGLLGLMLKYRPTNLFVWSKPKSGFISEFVMDCTQTINVDRVSSTWGSYQYSPFRHRFESNSELTKLRRVAHQKFIAHIGSLPSFSKSYLFGTGPSIETAFNYDFSDGYRIVCNTMIKNTSLMAHIKPQFLVAADAIYHFGISRYACQFRKDLESFLNTHRCIFLVPEHYYPNFIFHSRNLESVTVPVPYTTQQINLSMKESFEVKSLHNVLNQLLLPLGSSLCDNIYFLGFDGRKQTDRHFWKSTESVNYEDLKPYLQKSHPGFFQGINYEAYADMQSEIANTIMTIGEKIGKNYYSLNESTNKALLKRYIGKQNMSNVLPGKATGVDQNL